MPADNPLLDLRMAAIILHRSRSENSQIERHGHNHHQYPYRDFPGNGM
jgi:hypothetical protein